MLLLTTATGEMVCYLPVPSGYISILGRTCDEALQVAAGYNFYLMMSFYISFEITAVNGMIHYWRDDYSPAITLVVQILLYLLINVFAVNVFGEAEFYLAIGKVALAFGLILFTFITMVGGNPQHDAFGFRNWLGTVVNDYFSLGPGGRFQAFIAVLKSASFVMAGPEYLSQVSLEAMNPRGTKEKPGTMAIGFKTVIYRLSIFYMLGALSVSILVKYNDPTLIALASGTSNAASSPYVIAMNTLGIKVLPDIINVIIITSAFSAGNSYVYYTSRLCYSLAQQGFAPKILATCTKSGVPIYGIAIAMCFSLLSLMELSSTSTTALNYITSICTGSQVLNYVFICVAYISFRRCVIAQNIDRNQFVYKSWFQPYSIYFAFFFLSWMVVLMGYLNFFPGNFSVTDFIFSYVMLFVSFGIYVFWKILKKTKMVKPEEADLVTGLKELEEHEYEYFSKLENGNLATLKWHQRLLHWVF